MEALKSAEQISRSTKRGHNLALIALDFLATNNISRAGDQQNLARYLTRIADQLGLRVAAVDAHTLEPVVIDDVFLAAPGPTHVADRDRAGRSGSALLTREG